MSGGYNPLRYDCQDGKRCFNLYCRPKLEMFAQCFPGAMGLTDIDGFIEISGNYMFLEWKPPDGELKDGQLRAYEKLTRNTSSVVFLAVGDAYTMEVEKVATYWQGKCTGFCPSSLARLQQYMRTWGRYAADNERCGNDSDSASIAARTRVNDAVPGLVGKARQAHEAGDPRNSRRR